MLYLYGENILFSYKLGFFKLILNVILSISDKLQDPLGLYFDGSSEKEILIYHLC